MKDRALLFAVVALAVALPLSVALCEEPPAAADQQQPAEAQPSPQDVALEAMQRAQQLLDDGELKEAANVLCEAADKLQPSLQADQMRSAALRILAYLFVTEGESGDELEAQAERLLENASDKMQEQARLSAASIFIMSGKYGRAKEILNGLLENFPAPGEEELAEFRKRAEEAGRPDAVHPRLAVRQAAEQMLGSIEMIGKQAPHFEAKTLGGKTVSPGEFKGKVLLLDFWATWCAPCRRELPALKKTYQTYHEKGLEILGLSLDRDSDKLAAFLEAEKIPWPQVHLGDRTEELAKLYRFDAIPATFLIDRKGVLRMRDVRGE